VKKTKLPGSPEKLLSGLRGWQKKCVTGLRTAVRASARLDEQVKWGNLVYFANGPVLMIRAENERVLFGFWRGKRLHVIDPRLQASGKYEMATLQLREGSAISTAVVRRLVKEAVRLNKSIGDPTASARPTRRTKPIHAGKTDTSDAVDAFMKELVHPFKEEIEALRRIIRKAAPGIREGIKWNAPSYRTSEWFATTHLREKAGVALILHLGAKVKKPPAGGVAIRDPRKLLNWLGKDRAMIVFRSKADLADRKRELVAILRQWIRFV
jgi:hypothetical protein